ncbi:hypothetical protein ACED29_20745, partial [Shewanella sp. 5S214]
MKLAEHQVIGNSKPYSTGTMPSLFLPN